MRATLLGAKLSHSYSKEIHEFNGLSYDLTEVSKEGLKDILDKVEFEGYNVTIPYKSEVMQYLSQVSKEAEEIGAVNTISRVNGKLIGYNTDLFGLECGLERIGANTKNKNVLILGTGGAAKTAIYLSKIHNAKNIFVVSRSGKINYTNVYPLENIEIIINTTPYGMYPNNQDVPLIDISKFKNLTHVFDCIYNPLNTKLIDDAKNRGIRCDNGLYMLVSQAVKAEQLWGVNPHKNLTEAELKTIIDKSYDFIIKNKVNIILEGMPGCGKSTIGKLLAHTLNRKLIDVDEEIKKDIKTDISTFFEKHGEDAFRNIETEVVKKFSKESSAVIALGGGTPIRKENRDALKQNGIVFYIERDLKKLAKDERPITKALGVAEIYNKRKSIYESFSDYSVSNNGEFNDTVESIILLFQNHKF